MHGPWADRMRGRVTRCVALTLAVGLVVPHARGQESPGEELKKLIDGFTQAQQAFMSEYREAKTDEERQKLIAEKMPKADGVAAQIMQLAAKTPADAASLDGLVWVLQNVREPKTTAEAVTLVLEHHAGSDRLAGVCRVMATQLAPEAEDLMRALIEKNPHREVQGWACYSLARQLKQRAELVAFVTQRPDMKERLAEFYGSGLADRIAKTDANRLNAEIEELLGRVVKDYADVQNGTLAKSVERELFEIQNLAIGKSAPEIDGEDVDGVVFKLSEYRGKVVVLDFWGDF